MDLHQISKTFFKKTRSHVAGFYPAIPDKSGILIKRARGACLYDYDRNKYIDFFLSGSNVILGHNPHNITKQIKNSISTGISKGMPDKSILRMSLLLKEEYNFIDKIVFCSSRNLAVNLIVHTAANKNKDASYILTNYPEKSAVNLPDNQQHLKIQGIATEIIENGQFTSNIADNNIACFIFNPVVMDKTLQKVSKPASVKLLDFLKTRNIMSIWDGTWNIFSPDNILAECTKTPDIIILPPRFTNGLPLYAVGISREYSHLYEETINTLFERGLSESYLSQHIVSHNFMAGIEAIKLYRKLKENGDGRKSFVKNLHDNLIEHTNISSAGDLFYFPDFKGHKSYYLWWECCMRNGIILPPHPDYPLTASFSHDDILLKAAIKGFKKALSDYKNMC